MRALIEKWRRETEPWYGAVGLASLVIGTSSILIPLAVPQMLGGTVQDVGLLSSLASLMGVIGSLVWGRLSDVAHRRRPFVVMSYAMVAVSFAGIAFAHSLAAVVLLNMMLNLFWVANASVTVLLVIENRDESVWEGKIGNLNQMIALGWMSGLIFGSIALAVAVPRLGSATAIRAVFGVLALGGVVAALLALRLIPRTRPRFVRRHFRGAILALGNFIVERARFAPFHFYHRFNPRRLPALLWGEGGLSRETKRFLVAMLLAFTSFGFFFVPLPILLAERFGFSSSTVFSYFIVLNGAIVIAYPFAARRTKRVGNKLVLKRALFGRVLLFALGGVFLVVSRVVPSRAILSLFFFAIGASWSFFQLSSIAMTSRLAKPEYRGQTLGLYNAIAGLGTIMAGFSSGIMAQHLGYASTLIVAAILATAGMLVVARLRIPRRTTKLVPTPVVEEGPASVHMRTQPERSR